MGIGAPTSAASPAFIAQAREQYRLLAIGLLSTLVLATALPFSLNLVDPDLWGHVRYAQDWLAAGELPRTATHTYTAEGYPWVNHENGAELALALGYEHLGIYWMLVPKCLLGLGIMYTMARTAAHHGVPTIATWALLVLVAANLQAFFPLRPQLFSFALCSAALVCLDRAFQNWRAGSSPTPAPGASPTPAPPDPYTIHFNWLLPLPFIFAVWVNFHGGFVAGLCIVGALLLGRMVELAWRARRTTGAASPASHLQPPVSSLQPAPILGRLVALAAIGLACVAATTINPYGLGLHQWLWDSWGGAPPEITEWAPPAPGTPVFWPFVTLVGVAVVSLAATRRRRDWVKILILALVVWQASLHLRHIAFVALLCGFWLPEHWYSALSRLKPERGRLPVVLPALWIRVALAAALLAAVALESFALSRRLSDFPVRRSRYPVDALQYMADHRLTGRLVVAFNWAQYAIAALAPDVQVQFDGRFDTCYPQEVIDMHFDFLLGDCTGPRERSPNSGPLDGARALEHLQPDLVLVERRYKNPAAVMESAAQGEPPQWSLLYSDAVAELWGRRSRFDDPASPDYLPPDRRRYDVRLLEANFQWPALPDRSMLDCSPLGAPQPTPEDQDDAGQLTEL